MIKVLHILCALNDGGIEKLLYDYYRFFDKKDVHFDFAVNEKSIGMLEQKLLTEGSSVFRYTKFRVNFFKANKELKAIIKSGNYDVIHSHLANRGFGICKYARKKGAIVISHSHSYNEKESFLWKFIRKITTSITIMNSDYLFACGSAAGKWAWGKNNFRIMKNAIQISNYSFSPEKRSQYRKMFNLNKEFVLINVGRLSEQKNQLYALDIFASLSKKIKNAILYIVGDGDKKSELIDAIKNQNLAGKVFLLGARDDVPSLLNMADVFLLPSNYEGLPISLVEAQCSGLPRLVSNKVTTEVSMLNSTEYLSIDSGSISQWVARLEYYYLYGSLEKRAIDTSIIANHGYDIVVESNKMQKFYKDIVK